MKTLLLGLACSLAMTITGTGSHAQNIGIQFDKMPVGTKAYYSQSDGTKWVRVYKGLKRGKHVVEEFKGHSRTTGRPTQTRYYDSQGRLVFYRAYGERGLYKVSFKPVYCYYQIGQCKHTLKFTGGEYEGDGTGSKWVMNTQKAKGRYISTWYKVSTPDSKNKYFTKLGKYNLRELESWGANGRHFIKLVKIE